MLDVPQDAHATNVEATYRRRRAETHPDRGGATEAFGRVQRAFDQYNGTLLMDTEELAPMKRVRDMTGRSKSTVYRMIHEGTFPKPVLVGRRALWPVSRIHAWARQQVEADPRRTV